MLVYILGAGAMGCAFGAKLSAAGWRIHLIDVNKDQIDAINRNRLTLQTDSGEQTYAVAANTAIDAAMPADLIIVFTKSLHTTDAMASVGHLITDDTHVLTLQNGLGNAEKISTFIAGDRILEGVTTVPAEIVRPGVVSSHGEGEVQFYPYGDEVNAMAETIAATLNAAGIAATLEPAVKSAIWTKAIFNAAMNATCALLDTTPGPLGDQQDGVALIKALIDEGVLAAKAAGCHLDPLKIHAMAKMSMTEHRGHIASMLQDIRAGRRTEIDDINGALVEQARAHGATAPMHETLWRLMRVRERL
ncbi:ketopantoate reductase family protein [Hyphococcus luteus]|uniref:2-dehydropantoate 2-reductase n=1 Tax=Hyphococcus luteus TaxID=2058213 RepID=A0A2S7K304_9PROT|nr:2-dehydropantoate 2-reductase [Marinicaulis flavus]PQA86879.1 hypothetical protein CW354_15505 [Marinicaulis flavus]